MPEEEPQSLFEAASAVAEAAERAAGTEPAEAPPIEAPAESPTPETAETLSETPPVEATPPKRDLLDSLDDAQFGSIKQKYRDDSAALMGLAEAHRLVGQRSEEADRWRQLSQHFQAHPEHRAAFERILSGQPEPQPLPPPDPSEPPPTMEQVELWQTKVQAGTATPDEQARLTRVQQDLNKRLFDLAYRPQEVLGKFQEQTAAMAQKTIQQQWQQQQQQDGEQAALTRLAQEDANLLFVNGEFSNGYSEIGKLYINLYDEATRKGIPRVDDRRDYVHAKMKAIAMDQHLKAQQQAQAAPISAQAVHKADIAVAPAQGKTKEEIERMSFPELCEYQNMLSDGQIPG